MNNLRVSARYRIEIEKLKNAKRVHKKTRSIRENFFTLEEKIREMSETTKTIRYEMNNSIISGLLNSCHAFRGQDSNRKR